MTIIGILPEISTIKTYVTTWVTTWVTIWSRSCTENAYTFTIKAIVISWRILRTFLYRAFSTSTMQIINPETCCRRITFLIRYERKNLWISIKFWANYLCIFLFKIIITNISNTIFIHIKKLTIHWILSDNTLMRAENSYTFITCTIVISQSILLTFWEAVFSTSTLQIIEPETFVFTLLISFES